MPSIVILSLSQCHQVRGPYSGAGLAKPVSRLVELPCLQSSCGCWSAASASGASVSNASEHEKKKEESGLLDFMISVAELSEHSALCK